MAPVQLRRGRNEKMRFSFRLSTLVIGVTVIVTITLAYIQGKYFFTYFANEGNPRQATRAGGTNSSSSSSSFCSNVPSQMTKLWADKLEDILAASEHPDDPGFTHKEWTTKLLLQLSPATLTSTVRTPPPPDAIRRVLQTAISRIYNPDVYPPVRIVVLGGPTTEGINCEIASVPIPKGSIMNNAAYCAWPYRLESFLNKIFGDKDVFKVVNMGEDGTSTTCKGPLLKYRMYPEELSPDGPDVIVHAYSSADAAAFKRKGESPSDALRRELTTLVDSVRFSRECGHIPLVVHLDDSEFARKLDGMADRIMVVEYVNAVHKVSQTDNNTDLERSSAIPVSMAGHIAMVWVLAYNFANSLVTYCKSEAKYEAKFQREEMDAPLVCQEDPCFFSWIAGPTGTFSNPRSLQTFIQEYVSENDGWRVKTDMSAGFTRKVALQPNYPGDLMTLEYKNIPAKVRQLNFLTVKSNSAEWKNSEAKFTVVIKTERGTPRLEKSLVVSGEHAETTITYPFEITVAAAKGETISVVMELLKGTKFKVIGMMFCNR